MISLSTRKSNRSRLLPRWQPAPARSGVDEPVRIRCERSGPGAWQIRTGTAAIKDAPGGAKTGQGGGVEGGPSGLILRITIPDQTITVERLENLPIRSGNGAKRVEIFDADEPTSAGGTGKEKRPDG